MSTGIEAERERVTRWLKSAKERRQQFLLGGYPNVDAFFDAEASQVEQQWKTASRELDPNSKAYDAALALYHQAKKGIEPRRESASRRHGGYSGDYASVMAAALRVLTREVKAGKAEVIDSVMPSCQVKHGFKASTVREIQQTKYSLAESTVMGHMDDHFMFNLALIYLNK